jgi:alpha-mannosidase
MTTVYRRCPRRADRAFPGAVPIAAALLALSMAAPARADAPPVDPPDDPTLYVVACSHLDTQWWWTIQETITDLLEPTFADTMALFPDNPDFRFSWEGAFRYSLLQEYFPETFAQLKGWVDAGRWAPGGSAWDAGDVNVPSPESLLRHFLYGNGYFRRELGRASADVFLPDCFGFGYVLPTIAAHCGLKGFSTQKLTWGSAAGIPFDVGVWEGVDGSGLVAALDPKSYTEELTYDISGTPRWIDAAERQRAASGIPVAFAYFGVGDRGGSPGAGSVAMLQQAVSAPSGPLKVRSAFSDQLMRDLSPAQVAALPRYRGELLMTRHGTGSYTSQTAMKRWNRRNELLADAAERFSVLAARSGALPYPRQAITDAWQRFLWHQFHDDLTGTSIPEVYEFSWNDELLVHNRLAAIWTRAVGAASRSLDTAARGVPLVVANPLAFARRETVDAWVRFAGAPPEAVRVVGPDGVEVPAQVVDALAADDPAGATGIAAEGRAPGEAAVRVVFVADVPAMGLAVYDVVPAAPGEGGGTTDLSVTARTLENARYRVTLDDGGNIAQIRDLSLERNLLSAPLRLDLFDDWQFVWPAWEIAWENLSELPREAVGGTPEVRVVESGPARVAIEIRRDHGQSTYVQRIALSAGGERVDCSLDVDWHEPATFLKATFPLAASASDATYDLGVGTIRRGVNTAALYEVPAQQWADLTDRDGAFGVAVLTEDRYGWDKPDDGTLRLTLLRTPLGSDFDQWRMDIGRHRTGFAITSHAGDPADGDVAMRAAAFNQPLAAFQVPAVAAGGLPRSLAGLDVSPGVKVLAVKQAEASDEVVVRVAEARGRETAASLALPAGEVTAVRELLGDEQPLPDRATLTGPAAVSVDPVLADGGVGFELLPWQVRTFALARGEAAALQAPADSRPVALPWNRDAVSFDAGRADGDLDGAGTTIPGELFPAEIVFEGVRYATGPTGPGLANAVACAGQAIPLSPAPGDRLYVLAAGVGPVDAVFRVGDLDVPVSVQDALGWVGQWDSRVVDGEVIEDIADLVPAFYHPDVVAWYASHRHVPDGNVPYRFVQLHRYVLPVPDGAGVLVLPDDPRVLVFAVSLAGDPGDRVVAASVLHDGHDPLHAAVAWDLPRVAPPPEPEPVPEPLPDAPLPDAVEPADPGPSPDVDVPGDARSDAVDPGDDGATPGPRATAGGCVAGRVAVSPGGGPPILAVLLLAALWRQRARSRRAACTSR